MVLESFTTNNVAETARTYGIHANQLSRLSQLLSGARTQHFSNGEQQTRAGIGKASGHARATAGQEGTGDPTFTKVLGVLRPANWQLAEYARALIEHIAKALVDAPAEVFIDEYEDGNETVIELEVAEADLGKVIGRSGRVARALRGVLSAAGSKQDKRYALEIIE